MSEITQSTIKQDNSVGFISKIHMRLSKSRLGDLLVKKGLISDDQLIVALKTQEILSVPLGETLKQLGFISDTALKSTLVQQAIYRGMAFCLTAFIGFSFLSFSKSARAETFSSQSQQVQKAAISIPGMGSLNLKKDYRLFGSREARSTNLQAFTKFTGVIQRFNASLSTNNSNWVSDIMRFRNLSEAQKIEQVNRYVNAVPYVEDAQIYGKSDYWATPAEFFARNAGDCEDFALAKYRALSMLGISKDDMRIVIVQDKIKNIPHAVLVVYSAEGPVILDNQSQVVSEARHVQRYKPIYSINEQAWWRHTS